MNKKEKKELIYLLDLVIEYFEIYIDIQKWNKDKIVDIKSAEFIEESALDYNLYPIDSTDEVLFLCLFRFEVNNYSYKEFIVSEQPSDYNNTEFYEYKHFDKFYKDSSTPWWTANDDLTIEEIIEINEEKLRFLNHIKNKLTDDKN